MEDCFETSFISKTFLKGLIMKKKNTYEKYWREKMDYEFKHEFDIYKYLCGKLHCKKQISKVAKGNRFTSYLAWKKNNQDCCRGGIEELEEFHRYLNMCKRDATE